MIYLEIKVIDDFFENNSDGSFLNKEKFGFQ